MNEIITSCKQCGGLTSWSFMIDRSLPGAPAPFAPMPQLMLCPGHPTPKHDGRLDTREDDHQARVTLQENYLQWDNTKIVSISGGHGDIEASCCYLDPAQSLSLLAWLKQEEEGLKQLVGGDKA